MSFNFKDLGRPLRVADIVSPKVIETVETFQAVVFGLLKTPAVVETMTLSRVVLEAIRPPVFHAVRAMALAVEPLNEVLRGAQLFFEERLAPTLLRLAPLLENTFQASLRVLQRLPPSFFDLVGCEIIHKAAYDGDQEAVASFTVEMLGLPAGDWPLTAEVLAFEPWRLAADPIPFVRFRVYRLKQQIASQEESHLDRVKVKSADREVFRLSRLRPIETAGPQRTPLDVVDLHSTEQLLHFEDAEVILRIAQRARLPTEAVRYLLMTKGNKVSQPEAAGVFGWTPQEAERVRKKIKRSRFALLLARELEKKG